MIQNTFETVDPLHERYLPIVGYLIDQFVNNDKPFKWNNYEKPWLNIVANVSTHKNLCVAMRKKKFMCMNSKRILEVIEFNNIKYVIGPKLIMERHTNPLAKEVYNKFVAPHIQYIMPFMGSSIEYNIKKMSDAVEAGMDIQQHSKTLELFGGLCDQCVDKLRCALKNGKISRR
jgi:hypothetical protein